MSDKEMIKRDIVAALRRSAENGGRHLHHSECIHNLPPERQIEVRGKTVEWWMQMVGWMPVQITSADWETEPIGGGNPWLNRQQT